MPHTRYAAHTLSRQSAVSAGTTLWYSACASASALVEQMQAARKTAEIIRFMLQELRLFWLDLQMVYSRRGS